MGEGAQKPDSVQSGSLVESYSPIRTEELKNKSQTNSEKGVETITSVSHSLCPSARARAQWAAVKITLRVIIDPVQGYAILPVFTSAK